MRRLIQPSQKPPVGSLLNRMHPLSAGLIGAWLFNEGAGRGVLDSSGHGSHTGTYCSDTLVRTADAWGNPALRLPASVANPLSVGPQCSTLLNNRTEASLVLCYSGGLDGAATGASLAVFSNAAGNLKVGIKIAATTAGEFAVRTGAVTRQNYPAGLWPYTGFRQLALVTSITGGYIDAYSQGVLLQRMATTWTQQYFDATTSQYQYLNGLTSATAGFAGTMTYCYLYNRALSAAEVRSLDQSPYQMYRQPSRRRIFVPVNV